MAAQLRSLLAFAGVGLLAASGGVFGITATFQNGADGYTGCADAELRLQDGNYNEKVPPSTSAMLVIYG